MLFSFSQMSFLKISINTLLHVLGGHDTNLSCVLPIEVYDFTTDSWSESGVNLTVGRSKFCSVLDGQDVYFVGGHE